MNNTKLAVALAGLCCLPAMTVADEALMVRVDRLTLDTALRIAQGAVEACREKGIQIGATVVDRDGTVQAALRDTLAPPITLPISKGKAVAAVNFSVATSELASRADTPIGRVPGLVMSTGGIPVQAAGAMLGAVGVSGAPSGETDAECAQAGIDAVIDDLELGM